MKTLKRMLYGSAVTTAVLVAAPAIADAAPKFHGFHR